jgi:hypothetical protein
VSAAQTALEVGAIEDAAMPTNIAAILLLLMLYRHPHTAGLTLG